jgi:hypothetical protein
MLPPPRLWRDARTADARRALLEWARQVGNVTHAAQELGLTRRHLSRMLNGETPETPSPTETPGTSSPTETGETTSLTETGGTSRLTMTTHGGHAGVTPTRAESLTYGHTRPTLHPVETAATVDIHRMAIDLPKPWVDWLEQEALRRKQSGQQSRPAKSPVVLEALAMLRSALERERNGQ